MSPGMCRLSDKSARLVAVVSPSTYLVESFDLPVAVLAAHDRPRAVGLPAHGLRRSRRVELSALRLKQRADLVHILARAVLGGLPIRPAEELPASVWGVS